MNNGKTDSQTEKASEGSAKKSSICESETLKSWWQTQQKGGPSDVQNQKKTKRGLTPLDLSFIRHSTTIIHICDLPRENTALVSEEPPSDIWSRMFSNTEYLSRKRVYK